MSVLKHADGDIFPNFFNLINSNIGVGLLAMPYCFHECGIVLTIITLSLMFFAAYLSCILILETTSRLRCGSLERAALRSHGLAGRRMVELCIIGLLFGMLVSLNVAIGDLGSELFETLYKVKASSSVKRDILFFVVLMVLPFCFLRRLIFLSVSSFIAAFFYVLFFLNLFTAYTIPKVQSKNFSLGYFRFWRPRGFVHCVPIIASSICFQVQVTAIYSSLRSPSMSKMKKVLIPAVIFIYFCYLSAGLMGYLAFCHESDAPVAGDMLAMYPADDRAFYIRLGFLYTLAASIPLVLFPLRATLHSLLFEEYFDDKGPLTVVVPPTIPDARFRWLTMGVLLLSMVASQATDKVEIILSYTGGLAGGASCYLLPALIGAWTLSVRKRHLEMLLVILLLWGLGILVLLSPVLTFFGVVA